MGTVWILLDERQRNGRRGFSVTYSSGSSCRSQGNRKALAYRTTRIAISRRLMQGNPSAMRNKEGTCPRHEKTSFAT